MTPLNLAYQLGAIQAETDFRKRASLATIGGGALLGGIGGAISGKDYSAKRILGGALLGGTGGHFAGQGLQALRAARQPTALAPKVTGAAPVAAAPVAAAPRAVPRAAPRPSAVEDASRRATEDAQARLRMYQEGGISPAGLNIKYSPEDYQAFRSAGINLDTLV